jgi:hypothetical protein
MLIGVVWLGVLPRLQQLSPIRRRIELLEQQRIDAAALYYTDLEAMPQLQRSVDAAVAGRTDAFWRVGFQENGQ